MFTPQKKKLWPLSPSTEWCQKKGSISRQVSGLIGNSISPRSGETVGESKAALFTEDCGDVEGASINERISKLQNELFDYQYNMGILLIEKKEWAVKHGELKKGLAEATDAVRREQAIHSRTISEVEKREEDLKRALGVERQCVLDLEKALREMRSEYAEIKSSADSKLAEANALATSAEERSLEVEAKRHAADAKLAELNRKSSEIDRKLREVEAQESALRKDRSLFAKDRESHETAMAEQKEDLHEWEQKLQETGEKLADGRLLLNQREQRANENDKILTKRMNELEELRKKIDISNLTLKNKEDDISSRLVSLSIKEKEADGAKKRLEEKEKRLVELEAKLTSREKLEIKKLLDEQRSMLAEKEKEFELEMEQKRKLHDEQLKNKAVEVEKKEVEILHVEEKVKKREQAIETKLMKVKEKELGIDSKSKALKEREKSAKIEEKNLEKERKQVLVEKEDLLSVKAEVESLRTENEQLQVKINEERELLKVTEEERTDLSHLQSELKREIDRYRTQNKQLVKEADDLKQEKEKFEKEWEELDDKRVEIQREQEKALELKRDSEKLRWCEEERLLKEKLETEKYVQRELEALKLEKDSFSLSMEHEKSMLAEKYQREKRQLILDFEMKKQEFEAEMRTKEEEIENKLHEREKTFEQLRETELNNINYLREVSKKEMEELKSEKLCVEKDKMELLRNKKYVDAQQWEMKKDIEDLVGLSLKLKDQRELFVKEREGFIAFVEKQKSCDTCGDAIHEFMLSGLHPLTELENLDPPPLPTVAENYLKETVEGDTETYPAGSGSPAFGGTISWLQKCTSKIFKFSPGKNLELNYPQDASEASMHLGKQAVDSLKTLVGSSAMEEPQPPLQVNNSFDVQIVESANGIREVEAVQTIPVDQDPINIPETSQDSNRRRALRRKPAKGGANRANRMQPVKDKRSDSKANVNAEHSVHIDDESRAVSDLVEKTESKRKRSDARGSQVTGNDNQTEGHSDGTKDGDRPKRRQRVAAAEESIGQERYNLRHPKRSVGALTNGSLPQAKKGRREKETYRMADTEATKSENVETDGFLKEENNEPKEATTFPGRSEDGNGNEPVQSAGVASALSTDSPFINNGGMHIGTGNTSMNGMALSEEVIGTNEGAMNNSNGEVRTESHGESNGESDDEFNHPGKASIGKKLWTFLTT